MKITGGRGGIVMQQQLMAQRANKPNASNSKARKTGGDSDGGGETSRAQRSEQAGGINYKQLAAAVNAGVVRPPGAPRNREENNGNGGENSHHPGQAAKTAGFLNMKQTAAAATSQPSRAASGGYNASAQIEQRQSTYAKGGLVNLSA